MGVCYIYIFIKTTTENISNLILIPSYNVSVTISRLLSFPWVVTELRTQHLQSSLLREHNSNTMTEFIDTLFMMGVLKGQILYYV